MLFLIDAQLPPLLVHFFQKRGHTAQHVSELLALNATDVEIFELAKNKVSVVVTKDDDFARRSNLLGAPPQILWLRLGNCRNTVLLQTLDTAWLSIEEALLRGERIVELRAALGAAQ
jgi:predicted nuclease of predicted toxin-antitoxin system